jgi:hypothetical protein
MPTGAYPEITPYAILKPNCAISISSNTCRGDGNAQFVKSLALVEVGGLNPRNVITNF